MSTTIESPARERSAESGNGVRARIAPIPLAFLDRVRAKRVDDLDQPVKCVSAVGGEPCRDVLRRAFPGEELILASFTPFTLSGPYKEFGPVFVLAHDSSEPVGRDAILAGAPQDYLRAQFVIRAYSEAEEIIGAELLEAENAQAAVDRFFARPEVAFLHVRFPAYGCFACRLDQPQG